MQTMYLLEPEVAGGFGEQTVITNSQLIKEGKERIPDVQHLEYVFDDWLGDSILTSFPVFIITKQLAADIKGVLLTGSAFERVQITKSELFNEINPEVILPDFVRLVPKGRVMLSEGDHIEEWSEDDLCLSQNGDLIVTEHSLTVLRRHKLQYCEIKEIKFL